MKNSHISECELRDYLLGRVTDEARLTEIEELMFTDEEFCSFAEIAEDALIDDHAFGSLASGDAADFEKTLITNVSRRQKVAFASALRLKAQVLPAKTMEKVSILRSISSFFRQPMYAGGFAVFVVAILAASYFVFRPKDNDLADLQRFYQNERPTESRIADFQYAPLVVTRGLAEEREASRLRRIELSLLNASDQNPSAQSFRELGVFYLTQQKYDLAIEALKRAQKLDPANARVQNDLGSAYFESGRADEGNKRFTLLSTALEQFSKAVESDNKFAAALFNRSLCLQELGLNEQSRLSWEQYLEIDANSGWAIEARRNLERIQNTLASVTTKEQSADDMIAAYRNSDRETAWQIASQTREMASGLWLPDQLTRRFLEAKIRGDDLAATESIGALRMVGELERSKNGDLFVSEMAEFYSTTANHDRLLSAKNNYSNGFPLLKQKKLPESLQSFTESGNAFRTAGDKWNSMVADLWSAHVLSDASRVAESDQLLSKLLSESKRKDYIWLALSISDWQSNIHLLRNEIGRSLDLTLKNLETAEKLLDTCSQIRLAVLLADNYGEIGEVKRAAGYLNRIGDSKTVCSKSRVITWKKHLSSAQLVSEFGQFEAGIHFANEALYIAQNSSLKDSQAVDDTLRELIGLNRQKGDLTKALFYADETERRANETEDDGFRAKLSRYALQQTADLKREIGDNESALSTYNSILELQATDKEVQIDVFDVNKGKLLALMALGRRDELDIQLDKTLQLSESFRTKLLDDESRASFFDAEQFVYDAAIVNSLERSDHVAAFDLAETSRARNLLSFVEGQRSVAAIEQQYSTVSKPQSLTTIQSKIPFNTQIVEYALLKDRLVIWYITNNRFETIVKPIAANTIEEIVARFIEKTVTERSIPERVAKESNSLYAELISPVLPFFDKSKQLIIVPDRSLNKLPFAALISAETNRYLIEDITISYSPSTNVFVRTTESAIGLEDQPESLSIIGNPKFDIAENPELADLPAAEEEANKIGALYISKKIIIGQQATKENVLQAVGETAIFHFAGHYLANDLSVPNSKLVLASAIDEPDLRLSELATVRLTRNKLVVLSACDTNAEKIFSGEGATGIAQKFIAIGAPIVVAGNWKVDSDSTRDLMISFHKSRISDKKNVAQALRAAQLASMRSADGRVKPAYYWAAFSAVGGSTTY